MNVVPFNFNETEVRSIVGDSGEPLFNAKDICECLNLKDVNKAVSKLDEDDKGTQTFRTLGGNQNMIVVNESGLYHLIFASYKPEAQTFKRWVTKEVLPSIRKTGTYSFYNNQIDERDLVAFYRTYETLNSNQEFLIKFNDIRAKAYADINHGFLITTPELARAMGVTASTIRVLKKYYRSNFKSGVDLVELGHQPYWTRKGAGWIALHNRDGSFGKYLLSGELDKQLNYEVQSLGNDSSALLERFKELEGVAQ